MCYMCTHLVLNIQEKNENIFINDFLAVKMPTLTSVYSEKEHEQNWSECLSFAVYYDITNRRTVLSIYTPHVERVKRN